VTARVPYGLVLDGRGDDTPAGLSEDVRNSENCLVVSLCSAAREDDFIGRCGDKFRNVLSG